METIIQLTKEQAIDIYESKMWEKWSPEEKVKFQFFQRLLCMPFPVFHEAVEKVLNRPVWTHEFASQNDLIKEWLGEKPKPTMDDIINLIPKEKQVLIVIE